MDMMRHLRRWLNDEVLRELGDEYTGTIASVIEEVLNNRFRGRKALEPVITFEDGWRLCPNISQRMALVEMLGPQTDDWIGQRLVVYRHRVERKNAAGDTRVSWEKRVRLPATALRRVN